MPYKLISLVFLLFFLIINNAYSDNKFVLPLKKPSIFKSVEKSISSSVETNLPQKKPIEKKKTTDIKVEKKPKIKIEPEKKTNTKEIKQVQNIFVFPKEKPVTYKAVSKARNNSTILNQKDFERAKETIKFIKAKKWNSANKSAAKVSDRDFRTLINWM